MGHLIKKLNQNLRVYYQYYGVTDNISAVKSFVDIVKSLLLKWLNRRNQRRSYNVDTFVNGSLRTYLIIGPTVKISQLYG